MKKTKTTTQSKISSFFTKPAFSKLQLKKPQNEENVNLKDEVLKKNENGNSAKIDINDLLKGPIRIKPLHVLQEPNKNGIVKRKQTFESIDLTDDKDVEKINGSEKNENIINKTVLDLKVNGTCDDSPSKKIKLDTNATDNAGVDNKKISDDVLNTTPVKITHEIDPSEYSFFEDLDPDEFNMNMDENTLDLCQWQRCMIANIENEDSQIKLKLKSAYNDKSSTCILEDFWRNTILKNGDIVSVKAIKFEYDNEYHVSNNGGFLVLCPDNLITGTEIVGSLFCMRKTILQNSFRGIDGDNKNMIIGTLIHELVQSCLVKGIYCLRDVNNQCDTMLEKMEYIAKLYEANMTSSEASDEMKKITPYISEFIDKYVKLPNKALKKNQSKDANAWNGHINKIMDIEENIWSPQLGVSGRIDVTVNVTIHNKNTNKNEKSMMPLELKTGRPTGSVEHRGQVMLYTMLMSEILNDKGKYIDVDNGLLLYLRGAVNIQQITANYAEKKDLIMLRNQLAYYTNAWQTNTEDDQCSDGFVTLPEPINHHNACTKCPYLTICSIYQSENSATKLSDGHLLTRLKDDAIGHLSPDDVKYFLHWCKLIKIEDNEKINNMQKKDIWTVAPIERERRGKCLCNMIVSSTVCKDNQYEHKFERNASVSSDDFVLNDMRQSQFQVGGYVIISSYTKYAKTAGFITDLKSDSITVLLNKDLSTKFITVYNIDSYDSHSLVVYNYTNLGILMDNTDNSNKLRKIIIRRQPSSLDNKLSKNVLQKGKSILAKLNPIQQRAVLKALSAQDYLLIRGMPGTGKTQTLAALVELLVALDMTVVITSQTHSAVDTVLLRLKNSNVKMMRLGSLSRIHQDLHPFAECILTKNCNLTRDLQDVYDNINVVGVTCLGSNHSLLAKKTFDVCIVDESTQVLQCSILRPLFAAKKFVLVGDPDQLPPIVRSSKARLFGMDESLFLRLDGLGSTVSLTLQYRMNQTIMDLANSITYENQLKCADDNVANSTLQYNSENIDVRENPWLTKCLSMSVDDAVVVINTGNTYRECCEYNSNDHANFYSNICEVALIQHIVNALLKGGVYKRQIGIIAPYRDQVLLLQKHIQNKDEGRDDTFSLHYLDPLINTDNNADVIEINTVDQYQGRDKDVIIYSCTKTFDEAKSIVFSKENQILEDKRRLTVAITRAKYKLIMIGDVTSLRSYKPFRELFDIVAAKKTKNEIRLNDDDTFSWKNVSSIIF